MSYCEQKVLKKILERIEIDINSCWNYKGCKILTGYGHMHFRGIDFYVHRAMYILTYGEIPKGMQVLHRCDNPSCCNPEHLFLGTVADNMHDRDSKGRNRFSKNDYKNKSNKLTKEQIKEIKKSLLEGNTVANLAKEYGVHYYDIYNIKINRSYRLI